MILQILTWSPSYIFNTKKNFLICKKGEDALQRQTLDDKHHNSARVLNLLAFRNTFNIYM